MFEGDGLPEKICYPCKYQLEKSYSFRKKCENSDLKLRHHLKQLQEKIGDVHSLTNDEENFEVENTEEEQQEQPQNEQEEVTVEENSNSSSSNKKQAEEPSTEEDLVGVTQVAYIQPTDEPEEEAESITLPPETELISKEACTLPIIPKKEIVDANDGNSIFMIDEEEAQMMDTEGEGSSVATGDGEGTDYNAIANVVKATLATHPGINIDGELQMKINQQVSFCLLQLLYYFYIFNMNRFYIQKVYLYRLLNLFVFSKKKCKIHILWF